MRAVVILLVCLAVARGAPRNPERIAGGETVEIARHPYAAGLLYGWSGVGYFQGCGASILNTRTVLTVAHCMMGDTRVINWRIRVGSSYADRGGFEHASARIILHHLFNRYSYDNDAAIVQAATNFMFPGFQPVQHAPGDFNLIDGTEVWAIGWGIDELGHRSEQLREVQTWVVNHDECTQTYRNLDYIVTNNMVCVGVIPTQPRRPDQCTGDEGSALVYGNILVGVYSWGPQCADPDYPSVNTGTTAIYAWIRANL